MVVQKISNQIEMTCRRLHVLPSVESGNGFEMMRDMWRKKRCGGGLSCRAGRLKIYLAACICRCMHAYQYTPSIVNAAFHPLRSGVLHIQAWSRTIARQGGEHVHELYVVLRTTEEGRERRMEFVRRDFSFINHYYLLLFHTLSVIMNNKR